jgi:predicted nucleic acid-binding protein
MPRSPHLRERLRSLPNGSGQTSTPSSITIRRRVAEQPIPRGIIDTSVVIDLEHVAVADLPAELAVSAVTLAELAAGPHATADPQERAIRQDRLQRAEATFEPLPVDANVARAYGRIYAAVAGAGRKARGARSLDLLVAATALASNLPLYTSNPEDFRGTESLINIVALEPAT